MRSLSVYQIGLSLLNWSDYIISSPRISSSWFSQNREGISSSMGYFALYLIGVQIGHNLLQDRSRSAWWSLWKQYVYLFIILGITQYLCMWYIQPISRRLLNITYVCWLICANLWIILILLAIALLISYLCSISISSIYQYTSPWLIDVLNHHSLLFFLLSNLGTGLVNMSINTLSINDTYAIIILIIYLFTSILLVVIYHHYYHHDTDERKQQYRHIKQH